jgi:hypothetical protein
MAGRELKAKCRPATANSRTRAEAVARFFSNNSARYSRVSIALNVAQNPIQVELRLEGSLFVRAHLPGSRVSRALVALETDKKIKHRLHKPLAP